MRTRRTLRLWLLTAALVCSALAAAPAARAANGQFEIATCQSDKLNFSTGGFHPPVATLGMRVRIACSTEGHGKRGLILSNVPRKSKLPFNSTAAVMMDAPPGTQFQAITFGDQIIRPDCRYQVQLWAEIPGDDTSKLPIDGKPATPKCPPANAVKAEVLQHKVIRGRTRLFARIRCRARSGCSARKSNYLRIIHLEVTVQDFQYPAVSIIPDTPLAQGQWINGDQPLDYTATDNVGIRSASATIAGVPAGSDLRSCALAVPNSDTYDATIPCPNAPSRITVGTRNVPEGTQALAVTVLDASGLTTTSAPIPVRIDRTAPGRVDIALQDGPAWRNTNGFTATWTNPVEPDRAPIVGVNYKLCGADGSNCVSGTEAGDNKSSLTVAVPSPGDWRLSLWRSDGAGNSDEQTASDPVALRFDPDPPQLAFEPPSASDPTLVTVDATDSVSGVASGSIEISQSGSGVWQELPTQIQAGHLLARVDDAALPAGVYNVRAAATDQAQNEASTVVRVDGQPMTLNLPLRTPTALQAGIEVHRKIAQIRRRHGKRVRVQHEVTSVESAARVRAGGSVRVVGRMVNGAGQGVAGQALAVLASSSTTPEHQLATVQTDGEGRFSYATSGSSSETLRVAFAGSPVLLPAQASVAVVVPALTSLTVNRRHLRNGQAVTFTGSLQTVPAPPGGKLVELQVRLPHRWETFRTIRTDPAGHWSARYRFTRTYGVQRYRFRARLPEEAAYPFALGGSRPVLVVVRGG